MPDTDPRAAYAAMTEALISEHRANKGQIMSGPFAGRPVLLLTTTGAQSGQLRLAPLVYTRDGDQYVILGVEGRGTDPSRVVPQPPRQPHRDGRGRRGDVHGAGESDRRSGARAALRQHAPTRASTTYQHAPAASSRWWCWSGSGSRREPARGRRDHPSASHRHGLAQPAAPRPDRQARLPRRAAPLARATDGHPPRRHLRRALGGDLPLASLVRQSAPRTHARPWHGA